MKVKYLILGLLATLLPATAVLADGISAEEQKTLDAIIQKNPDITPEEIKKLEEYFQTHSRGVVLPTAAQIENELIAIKKHEAEARAQQAEENRYAAQNKPLLIKEVIADTDSVKIIGNGLKKGTCEVTVITKKPYSHTYFGAIKYSGRELTATFTKPIGKSGDVVTVRAACKGKIQQVSATIN